MAKHSLYGCDFQNWGDLNKLVVGRPEERYYPLKFRGQSSFAADQKKVQNNIEIYNKKKVEQAKKDEFVRLAAKFEMQQKKKQGSG